MRDLQVSASPLQIGRLFYEHLHVTAEESFEVEEDSALPIEFDFTGVRHHLTLTIGSQTPNPEEESELLLRLHYQINNEEGKKAPYRIDALVGALVRIHDKFRPPNRVDLVRVNGASVLYGAIREMVANITSRHIYGEMWLPTLRFIPCDKGNLTTEQVEKPSAKE